MFDLTPAIDTSTPPARPSRQDVLQPRVPRRRQPVRRGPDGVPDADARVPHASRPLPPGRRDSLLGRAWHSLPFDSLKLSRHSFALYPVSAQLKSTQGTGHVLFLKPLSSYLKFFQPD
jgi:hypothetical protein